MQSSVACNWCKWRPFTDQVAEVALQIHVASSHLHDAILHWPASATCPWPDCKTATVFRHPWYSKEHLQNIHLRPLMCDVLGCNDNGPFAKKSLLLRHKMENHGKWEGFICDIGRCAEEPKAYYPNMEATWIRHDSEFHGEFSCFHDSCEHAAPNGFSTMEDLRTHLAHKRLPCLMAHCYYHNEHNDQVDDPAWDLSEHILRDHGDIECRLGACDGAPESKFSTADLGLSMIWYHLRADHRVSLVDLKKIKDQFPRNVKVFTPRMIPHPNNIFWANCERCLEQKTTEARRTLHLFLLALDQTNNKGRQMAAQGSS